MYWGFTGKSLGIIDKIAAFLNVSRKAVYLILDVIGTALIGIGGAWLTSKGIDAYSFDWNLSLVGIKQFLKSPIFLICVGLILYAIAKYFQWYDNNKLFLENKNLIDKNNTLEHQMRGVTEDRVILSKKLELAYRELVITWLGTSMQSLHILNPNTRATVYYFKDNVFHYVGRHSKNPTIAQVSTNKVVLNGGVLSKAWIAGNYEDLKQCPIYSENEENYFEYQLETYGFEKEKVNKLVMKPCQYYAKTIVDGFDTIGIIIFECDARLFNLNKVGKIGKHCTEHQSNLISYIKNFRDQDFNSYKQGVENVEDEFMSGLKGELDENK